MTGFAAVSHEADGRRINATVKSVNHRFLDVVVKAPQSWAAHDNRIRAITQQRLARGRVEVSLSVETVGPGAREVVLDEALIAQVATRLEALRSKGLLVGSLSISDVLRLPQVLEVRSTAPDASGADGSAALVEHVVTAAVEALITMRSTEGRFLAADLDARLSFIAAFVEEVERLARNGQAQLEQRLRERVAAMPPDLAGDPAAVAQEIVRYAARSDIDEELVRLRGHLDHWRELAQGAEPCGRKLDFLVQEMNREINTIGSKVEGVGVTERVIGAKAELERLREQVQNVE